MLKKLENYFLYGKWTKCQHLREEIDNKYLIVCADCGACLR